MRDITQGEYWDEFERRQLEPVDAVPTHLPMLNRMCHDDGGGKGIARGWFVTVGANPGFGKSGFALNLMAWAARHREIVAYCSLEMTDKQLAARFYAISSGVPIMELEKGTFNSLSFGLAKDAMSELPPILLPDRIITAWEDIVAFCQEAADAGARYFVIDYLQLIQTGDEEQITRAITQVVTDIRAWAADKAYVVIALSQFNRTTSSEYHARPRSQGLWGGMILEASSDMVLLLDHSRYERDEHARLARTFLIVDKNRHGPVADIPILWDYKTLRMREGLPDEVNEWPS